MKKFYLALERGLFQKSMYPLLGDVTIGRSSQNDITLVDLEVSRSHAMISLRKGNWVIEDLGSTNGIILAGERVVKRILETGDAFQIGEFLFRFMDKDVLEDTHQLYNTMTAFMEFTEHQSHLLESYQSDTAFATLQDTLLSTRLFKSLGDKAFRDLGDSANLHLLAADQLVVREGDPGRSIYIIVDGQVKVFTKGYESKEIQLATLAPNQFFGEMALLTGQPRTSWVVTTEESLLSEISYNNMRRIMFQYPEVKDIMLAYLTKRAQNSREKRAEAGVLDRRQHPRLNERFLVKFKVLPTETLPEEMISHTYRGTTSDISLDGTQLMVMGPAMEAFCQGCKLRLQIELPLPWGRHYSMGVIRRVIPGKQTIQLGIEFFGNSFEEKEKLKNFIYGEDHSMS